MPESNISADDPYPRQRLAVLDSEIAYIDTGPPADGSQDVALFLHGNPTSSYLWRNVIPQLAPQLRCLAPDLIGMGASGPSGDGDYRFVDHRRYLDAWLAAALPSERILLVVHDWGSALGFSWAQRHPERIRGIAYMEAIVRPLSWADWPDAARSVFQGFRSPAGEEMVLEKNVFVENVLPGSVLRGLTEAEMAVYRRPYLEPGESRRPTLTWPREIPIDGEPADVNAIVAEYSEWLAGSDLPKLLVKAEPGAILTGPQLEFCRTWPNQREVSVEGIHFLQEDSPAALGTAIAEWYRSL